MRDRGLSVVWITYTIDKDGRLDPVPDVRRTHEDWLRRCMQPSWEMRVHLLSWTQHRKRLFEKLAARCSEESPPRDEMAGDGLDTYLPPIVIPEAPKPHWPEDLDRILVAEMELFQAYYRDHPDFGALKAVMKDGRFDDGALAYCAWWAKNRGDEIGAYLVRILQAVTVAERRKFFDWWWAPVPSGGTE